MYKQHLLSTLFPYTTLFRSAKAARVLGATSLASRARSASSRRKSSTVSTSYHVGSVATVRSSSAARSSVWPNTRSEEHTSELQSRRDLVCRLLLDKK